MPPVDESEISPELYRAIVEQAPEAVIFADRDGMIRLWNDGARNLFGYAAAEVLGGSLDVIIPERLRKAHWAGFQKAIDSGRTRYAGQVMTTRSMNKNGSRLYVDLSFALVTDRSGAVMGAMAVGRDCTARYAADGALRARVVELEKKLQAATAATAGNGAAPDDPLQS